MFDLHARIRGLKFYSEKYYAIDIDAPAIAEHAQPGQFTMVHLPEGTDAILRRPLAIARLIKEKDRAAGFSFLVKIIGKGTRILGGIREGMTLKILGPLGKGFSYPHDPQNLNKHALIIGGGIGAASLFFLIQNLIEKNVPVVFIYGGRQKADLSALDWVEQDKVELILCTEDGSEGFHGLVTGPLEDLLKNRKKDIGPIYACGPESMMREVTRRTLLYGRDPEVSLEARMGCGLGACLSCVVSAKSEEGKRRFRRICMEGPVFKGAEIFSNGH